MYRINHANIKEWAANYDGPLFDGILCDPPYELGFMGKSWDSSGIAFDTEMWADLFKLLKPGGHLLAFSGSRTYHRMAVAIEDAGFEIRDMIEWVYGSGFPKSLNIGKAVDKIQGNERESEIVKGKIFTGSNNNINGESGEYEVTKGTSPYEGYGTALKPAHEPCVLARKPLEKGHTVATNALKHGTGGLNIDGTRVGTETTRTTIKDLSQAHGNQFGKAGITYPTQGYKDNPPGRFPANLIHDGSDEVEAVFPQNAKGMSGGGKHKQTYSKDGVIAGGGHDGNESHIRNDSGSASRFFMTCKDTQKHAIMNIWNDIDVSIAGSSSTITQVIEKVMSITSALGSVPLNIDLVNQSLNALFVGTKSKSTEIDFVAKLVAIKEVPEDMLSQQELKAIQGYMQNSESSTQTQSHVSGVENKDSTDITQITINLLKLCGYVLHAIDENTKQANQESDSDQAKTTRFLYTAKASKSERNAGLEGFEVKIGKVVNNRRCKICGYQEVSGSPCRCEQPDWEILSHVRTAQNFHPTVKPLALTKYLATLIKPPTGGRLLVPFSGSGSEMIGALQAGWEYVEGVELTEEYIPIAEARIEHWLAQMNKQLEIL